MNLHPPPPPPDRDYYADSDANDSDSPPTLSPYALEDLRQFLHEQNLLATTTTGSLETDDDVVYSPETAGIVEKEVLYLLDSVESGRGSVACLVSDANLHPHVSALLLEYDRRFELYGDDFMFYDYNQPIELPQELQLAYQVVVADPPYLSGECLEKVAQMIEFLANREKVYLFLLTGDVQSEKAAKLLGLRPCGFRPEHSSKLGNEFRLFTNYDPEIRIEGWE
ncbi:EEF1A lysine methyltransferase 1-like protein [Drosera capensis]